MTKASTALSRSSLDRLLSKRLTDAEIEKLKLDLENSIRLEVGDLWERPELARTYWILLINGIDDEDERGISAALASWKHLAIKDSARVVCIQTSERDRFKFACRQFGVDECPALILSDSPLMESFLKFDQGLLVDLQNKKGTFQRFLNRLHTMVENGYPLEKIGRSLNGEKFWKQMKLVYGEVKSLFSISVSASADVA